MFKFCKKSKKYIIKVDTDMDLYVGQIRQEPADNAYGFVWSYAPTNLKKYAMQFGYHEAIELAETIPQSLIFEFNEKTWKTEMVNVSLRYKDYPPKPKTPEEILEEAETTEKEFKAILEKGSKKTKKASDVKNEA